MALLNICKTSLTQLAFLVAKYCYKVLIQHVFSMLLKNLKRKSKATVTNYLLETIPKHQVLFIYQLQEWIRWSFVCNGKTINIMAQALQLLFILLLPIIALICHPKGVKSLEYSGYNFIVGRDLLSQQFLKSGYFRVADKIDPQVGSGQHALQFSQNSLLKIRSMATSCLCCQQP